MTTLAHMSDPGDPLEFADHLPVSDEVRPAESRPLTDAAAREFTDRWSLARGSVRAFLNGFLADKSGIDDCLQEVAVLAWKKGPSDGDASNFAAFCMVCARNVAMAEIRKKYKRQRMLSPEMCLSLGEAIGNMEAEELARKESRMATLKHCMDSLEAAPRRLLELRYTSGDNSALLREAQDTGTSIDAIYKKLERLRKLLKDCVARKLPAAE